jgi:hypothetical protein
MRVFKTYNETSNKAKFEINKLKGIDQIKPSYVDTDDLPTEKKVHISSKYSL